MTMMMAKCFAKGCTHKTSSEKNNTGFNLKDWKPCMGCRSHWIHVVCGGFCSECQPLSPAIVDTVKSIYSSTGTGTEVASKIRRSSDRSPLSVKQSQLAKRLQDSSGFKEGKENTTSPIISGKRQRKPVAPPALTANIVPTSPTKIISSLTAAPSSDRSRKRSSSGAVGAKRVSSGSLKSHNNSMTMEGPYLEGFEEDFEPPQMVIQSPSPNKSPPNKSDNNNLKPDEIVKDKDVKKQDNNNENSDEETLKTPENNNKKQPDLSIGLVKQQQENKENIEDLLERIEEIFETGGEAGEETTKKRYKCPICSSTFSHRRNVRPHLENLHKCIQSMDGKRKKDTKVVETKEKTKSPKSEDQSQDIVTSEDRSTNFKCSKCTSVFTQKGNLTRHIKNIHEESIENNKKLSLEAASPVSKSEEKPTIFKCSVCPSVFTKKGNLTRHTALIHEQSIQNNNKKLSSEDASPATSKATQPKKPKNLKRKLSASNLLASELPTAKKAKKSSTPKMIKTKSGGKSKTTPRGTSKTAPGGTPKKYASEPHTKLPRGTKVKVEVKIEKDGTHNPDRLLFHIRTNLPIDKGEPEALESYDYLNDMSNRQIDDFDDVNDGEKAFFKLWNTHLHLTPCYGDSHLGQILENFIDQYGLKIHRDNLYGNFVLHLSNLSNFDAISSSFMLEMINRYQGIIKDMIENPEKYPLTPVKVPIENPYYVPKPVSVESLKLMQNLSSLRKSKSQNSVKLMYDNKKKSGPSKSFWVKKSFRNPVALSSAAKKKKIVKTSGSEIDTNGNQEDDLMSETEMEKRWPRKKAYVNFANEIFVDEIKDLNDKSTGHLANFMHDVTDLYKFISPRFRRGTSL